LGCPPDISVAAVPVSVICLIEGSGEREGSGAREEEEGSEGKEDMEKSAQMVTVRGDYST
jgi:hypothetical protein